MGRIILQKYQEIEKGSGKVLIGDSAFNRFVSVQNAPCVQKRAQAVRQAPSLRLVTLNGAVIIVVHIRSEIRSFDVQVAGQS